jgi:hypothetical protein
VRKCRRVRTAAAQHVSIQRRDRRASYGGLQTCGSIWACPACAAKIAAERGEQLQRGVQRWHDEGGSWLLVTATLRHHARQPLLGLLDAISPAWKRGTSNRRPRKLLDAMGSIGMVRSIEVNHGANGWHPHVHALVAVAGTVTAAAIADLEAAIYDGWASSVERSGFARPSREHGVRVQLLDLSTALEEAAGYIVKQAVDAAGASRELTGHAEKRVAGRTPFGILGDLADDGLEDDLALTVEYQRATKGRRRMAWTKGLRERLVLEPERDDDEIAADTDREGRTLALLSGETWAGMTAVRGRPGALLAAVTACERDSEVLPMVANVVGSWGLPGPLTPPGGTDDDTG